MAPDVRLSHLYDALAELTYPLSRDEAVAETDGLTLVLADGTIELEAVIRDVSATAFESRDDLIVVIMSHLPRRAVGEPYQSEGEG